MGIQGLLPLLKRIQKPVSIAEHFAGQVIGVDAYCWLHKGAYGCAMELVEGKKSSLYINYVLKRINMLLHFNVKPILVFDGCNLPSKAGQEERRRKTRQENKAKGLAFLRAGNRQQAVECFQKCVDITPEMALEVIKECRKKGVECIVAPYEADAQLAYLMKAGIAQAIISEDSDLLVYGCKKVIFKMDSCGHGMAVDLADLSKLTDLKLHEFTQEKFRHMCILSGCDYLPSVKGIGLHKAIKLLRKSSTIDKVIKSLRLDAKLQVPADYEKSFKQADETFLYQLVFDPLLENLVPLNELPEGLKLGDLQFAGPSMSKEKALGIAVGNINPITGEVLADFNSRETKIVHLNSNEKSDDSSGSLTPVSTSSFGHSVMNKRGKTGYDVQKSLSGLMLDSQPTANTKKPFLPPGAKRKAEEDDFDDHSLFNMYTAVKRRPKDLFGGVPEKCKRKASSQCKGTGIKRSKFRNPFKVCDQGGDVNGPDGTSRYFNLSGSPELPKMPPDESKGMLNGGELDGVATDKTKDADPSSAFKPGAVLTLSEETTKERLCGSEFGNRVEFDENTDDKDKENEPLSCDPHHSSQSSVEILESQGHEQGEISKAKNDVFLKIPASLEKVQKQGVLTTSNTQLISPRSGNTRLNDLFGYKPSFRTREIDDNVSVDSRENEVGAPVNTIVVVNIESGYLSDTEMSTDSNTPISTPSALSRPAALSSTGKLHFGQGSAVGTKTMKKQIQLKSKPGSRSTGLGRCRAMGLTKRKSVNNLGPDSKQTSAATATLFSYFEFDRRKRPKLESS
ncbi:exonuclease 1-like isoform X2 [Acropora millepora]|uniref:exonuclease 1-like isoform X2 n=1 Tax=Acropora millepora TaxID=45264 RepID=UPI001CF500D3|nr:exonuclease 1-like isoform X2 [Acropora millepora]